jgi:hypothetical protein
MVLKRDEEGIARFKNGKFAGQTLGEVAGQDPSYLNWAYRKGTEALSDELFYELDDAMTAHGISRDPPPRKKGGET